MEAVNKSEYGLDLITGVMNHWGHSVSEALEYIEDNFLGEWESLIAYAWSYLEDCGEWDHIPKHLQYYFNIEAYARDLELNGDIIPIGSDEGVYILNNG